MKLLILFLFITKTFCNNDLDFVNNFLIEFGYKDKSDSLELNLENISPYISIFQEYHKLTIDGQINNETLQLMKSSRCGNKDIQDFTLWNTKWNTTVIKWHYYLGKPDIISLTKQAFSFWESYSSLSFEHNVNDYNILIVDKRLQHNLHIDSTIHCSSFAKYGSVLGHAYPPYFLENKTEIHINLDQKWYYKNDSNVNYDQISLLYVLIHEIGHALGILHSHDSNSIMYSTYSLKIGVDINLGFDDQLAIQALYGLPKTTEKTTTYKTIPDKTTEQNEVDLCKIKYVNKFVIVNKKIYIVHGKMFWKLEDDNYESPSLLTDWLNFIPSYFNKIYGMYQRPSGNVVLIIDNFLYVFDMNTLQVINTYSLQKLGFMRNVHINCIFNSYSGRTFIIYNDQYYKEFDECGLYQIKNGYINDIFFGIPKGVDSCFRYNDGFIYFFKNNSVYKFNEFTDESFKTNVNPLSIIKIKCTQNTINNIIQMLQNLIQ